MDVQTCMRGFSFMPKNNIEVIDLKYVEKDALEQTWKSSRRQRLKQQEQKIWDQFVQEKDIVSSVCKDDPYQFLHQLPESCIKELLEEELQKMKNEQTAENEPEEEQQPEAELAPVTVDTDNHHVVTVVEEEKREDMFHIFDDEVSGPEEILNDSVSSPPCTVRERSARDVRENESTTKCVSPDKASSKSSENVTNIIESSIYCAKVKDLRLKINVELLEMIATLERQDLTKIEPEEVGKLIKRSGEFCTRFNRVYLYQLHRQVHEVQRGSAAALPFARHTQFQSQMVRIVSLHQNLLQTVQVFHKSIAQTACIRDSGEALRTLVRTARDASAASRDTAPPAGLSAAHLLYDDDIQESCNKLEDCLNEYTEKLAEYLDNFEHAGKSKKGKHKDKKKSLGAWSKSGTKSGTDTDGRLSMYSLDTLRLNMNSKSSICKGFPGGASKIRGGLSTRRKEEDKEELSRGQKKSPKNRRPLMRDPAAGKPRRKQNRELDVPTLVEAVTACASSHISRENTPHHTPRESNTNTPRHSKDAKKDSSKKLHGHTPRRKGKSPKSANRMVSPETHGGEREDRTKQENDDLKLDNNLGHKLRAHDINVELNIKSPKKIVEGAHNATVDRVDIGKAQHNDINLESKRTRDSPKSVSCQENALKLDKELVSPKCQQDGNTDGRRNDRDKKASEVPGSCEVSRLLRQLCNGDASGGKNEKTSGAKNAQLLCVNSTSSPRQPSTPQLLRILEETIQKKTPKPLCPKTSVRDTEKLRLTFNIPEKTTENLFQYRTKFVQHMLTSSMYANSAVGKPWEMIGSISDQIIDELLLGCAKEMELTDIVQELYTSETQ